MFKRVLLTLVVMVFVTGCSAIAPQDKIDFAKHFVSLFASGKFDEIRSDLHPQFNWLTFAPFARKMATVMPKGRLLDETDTWNTTYLTTIQGDSSNATTVVIYYHYAGPTDLRATVRVQRLGNRLVVTDVYFFPIPNGAVGQNDFTLQDRAPIDYVAFAAAFFVLSLILVALIQLIRSKGVRWRLLWAIFIILGIGRFMLNWTTGKYAIAFLAFQIFGVGFLRASPYDPWILSLSLPVGAIIFLARRRTLLENAGYAKNAARSQTASGPPRDMRG